MRVDAAVDAYVPSGYVGLEAAKMDVHRRIALAASVDDLRELEAELADRFGSPPEPVANLIGLQEARIVLAPLGAVAVSVRRDRVAVSGVVLGPSEARSLREHAPGSLYNAARREVALRVDGDATPIETARNLCAGIIEVRSEVGAASL